MIHKNSKVRFDTYMLHSLAIAALMNLSTNVYSASFDCAKASNRIENSICTSPKLSKLDSDLDVAYRSATASSSDPIAIKVAQRLWIKGRRNLCTDEPCLVSAYQNRIAILDSSISNSPTELQPDTQATLQTDIQADKKIAEENTETNTVASSVQEHKTIEPPSTSASTTQTNPSIAVATALSAKGQSTEISEKEMHDRLIGAIVLIVIIGSALAFLVIKKQSKWKIALSAVALLIVIASYVAPPLPKTEKTNSIEELNANLTGKWTTDDDVAPECSKNAMFMIREPDGAMQIISENGQLIDQATWQIEKAYDKNLGVIGIEHPGKPPIYWVVKFSGHDMKTSIMLSYPPATKSEALKDLAKLDPQNPDIKLPLMHKCAFDTLAVPETVKTAQGSRSKTSNDLDPDLIKQLSRPSPVKKRSGGFFGSWGVEKKCHHAFYDKGGDKVDGGSGYRGTFENEDGSYSAIFQGFRAAFIVAGVNLRENDDGQGWHIYKCDVLDDGSATYYMVDSAWADAYMKEHK